MTKSTFFITRLYEKCREQTDEPERCWVSIWFQTILIEKKKRDISRQTLFVYFSCFNTEIHHDNNEENYDFDNAS